ncbi:molybdenum cofactor guanylyltransferase [Methanotorris formicicus]|uniref:Probable molybdenum cofactor guanylyltransferase n=1 Tax=Methanotorris formicicus Mc-S-70 TaxID=647171 RepID=H1KZE7_9EURY|nr:molybdenum cofactor guanylyltransferase [Methanotorris formicicus]EHP86067.1 molybdopterin-guanine dinucleotide biosynthesis protein A (MobA) [Methanotorris formicicus Mc-S-70]
MISGIILSGGKARRMKGEKAFRIVNGKYLIEYTVNLLNEMDIPFVVVFKNDNEKSENIKNLEKDFFKKYRQTITWDLESNKGPLMGILSGMRVLNAKWVLVLPCDMPFINRDAIGNLIKYIDIAEKEKKNCIIPMDENGYIEPLFSLYMRSSLEILDKMLKNPSNKNLSMRSFIEYLSPLYVDVKEIDKTKKVFININTLEELKKINSKVQ